MSFKKPKHLDWTPEETRRFWAYQSSRSTDYFSRQVSKPLLRLVAPWLKGARSILDYGCGPGFLLEELLKRGFHAAGTDFSAEALEMIQSKFKNHPGFDGTYAAHDLAQVKKTFDAIFVLEVIEHLNDAALAKFMEDLERLLNPRGILILSTPNNENLSQEEVFCPSCEQVFHRMQHVRSWSSETLEQFLKSRGFTIETMKCTHLAMLGGPFHLRVKFMLKRLLGRAELPNLVCVARRSGRHRA